MQKIFLLSFDLQRDEISTFCFDKCGKVSVGAVSLQLYEGLPDMYFLPCTQPTCPNLDRQMDEPSAETEDTQFFLRKLSSLQNLVNTQASSDIAGEGDAPLSQNVIDAINKFEVQ